MIARKMYYLFQSRRNLRIKPSLLKQVQLKKLRFMIWHAYENVPYYHRKFDEVGVKPDDIKCFGDLVKIPLTTKSEIQERPVEDFIARNFDVNKCLKRTTSGSTGKPLTTFIDPKAEDFEGALWTRAFLENTLRLGDRMAVIVDPRHFPKSRSIFQLLGYRKYLSIFDDPKRHLDFLEDYRTDAIRGYSSSIEILANYCNEVGASFHPSLVFTSAELLDRLSREKIKSIFEAELFDNYACSEFSLLAWECREHSGYHINADSVFMEFFKDGETFDSGECGEVVCTSLANYAMPLIRYRLGDAAVPEEDACPCGVTLPLIKIMAGRTDDFLAATDGSLIPPTVFFPFPFENVDWIRQFRVLQKGRKKLIIQVVAKEGFPNQSRVIEYSREEIQKVFGVDMEVDFQFLEKIPRDLSGKCRKVISYVNG